MSVVRIYNPKAHTIGWQARWPIPGGQGRRLTRFFSDSLGAAYERAQRAEKQLRRTARSLARA